MSGVSRIGRILVAGGLGTFGALAVERLRALGASPLVAARRGGGDLVLDVESPSSIRSALREGDVVLDAAGPFQTRSVALATAAVEHGFHVVDLSDSLAHAERLDPLSGRLSDAGIAVLTSCSTVSAISAAVIATSGVKTPTRVAMALMPSAGATGRGATAQSLLASVGRPIRVRRDGALVPATGFSSPREFVAPEPVGRVRARLMESADSLLLPRVWPTLRDVSMRVHCGVVGLDALLGAAAKSSFVRALVTAGRGVGTLAASVFGRRRGSVLWEIEGEGEAFARIALSGAGPTHAAAVVPAALAAVALSDGSFGHRGLVPADRHVVPATLFSTLASLDVVRVVMESRAPDPKSFADR